MAKGADVTKDILKGVYPVREPWVHKGRFGRLLVVGGSARHTGSPCFVSAAAYRAGCDLVFVAAPQRAADVAAAFSPNIITQPLAGEKIVPKHVEKITRLAKEIVATAAVIGPGLWREKDTLKAILQLIKNLNPYLPLVIDADAIRAIGAAKNRGAEYIKKILGTKKAILTPHADEFAALSGKRVTTELSNRIAAAEEVARELGCVIILKGHVDVITNGVETFLNKTGSTLMTKGGMGDTLAGICGGLLARGVEPFTAAQAAAFINGTAGELAARKFGESVLATDLIEQIPAAIKPKR